MIRKIFIGADQLGYEMKQYLVAQLTAQGVEVVDTGCQSSSDERFYPEIAAQLCKMLLQEDLSMSRGVLVCGTGLGMTIMANKFLGIYAAHCHDMYSCERSILSNRANVICFGAQIISNEFAWEMLEKWISLSFVDGRSTPKLQVLEKIEADNFQRNQG